MGTIAKKTGTLLLTLLLVSAMAFLAFQIIPGDPVTKILGTDYTPERAATLRHELGLEGDLSARYLRWLAGFITGDFGISYSYMKPVRQVMQGKLAVTAALSVLSWLLVLLFSIPLFFKRNGGKSPPVGIEKMKDTANFSMLHQYDCIA